MGIDERMREKVRMHINTLLIDHNIDTSVITTKEVDFKSDAIITALKSCLGEEIRGIRKSDNEVVMIQLTEEQAKLIIETMLKVLISIGLVVFSTEDQHYLREG